MKMKRVLSVCAAVSVALGSLTLNAFAADSALSAVSATTYNSVINISGRAEGVKGTTAVMVSKKGQSLSDENIEYFGDVKFADDGQYSLSFPCGNIDLSEYEVSINNGNEVIKTNVQSASQQIEISFKELKNNGEVTAAGFAATIGNLYKIDLTNYKFIAAAYAGDRLESVIYENASEGITGGKFNLSNDVTEVRCFLWNEMVPQIDEPSKPIADFKASAKSIVTAVNCWGDSLTYGFGGNDVTYPAVIDLLADDSVTVTNYGVGGERTREIAGRMGAVPFTLSSAVTIPADTTTSVLIEFNGGEILKQGGNNKYSIGGIDGTLAKTNQPTVYSFTRAATGEAKTVEKGTEVLPIGINLAGVNVIWTGANDRASLKNDFDGTKNYIFDLQANMISKINQASGDYVVVGIAAGDANSEYTAAIKEFEEYQAAKYGDKFINLRSILTDEKTYAAYAAQYSVSLTDTDKAIMAEGRIPTSVLSSDGLHFNKAGYALIGKIIYNKLMTLGFVM